MPMRASDRIGVLADAFELLHRMPSHKLPEAVRLLRRLLLAPQGLGAVGLRLVREEDEEPVERAERGRVEVR